MNKKLFVVLLVICMALAACSSNNAGKTSDNQGGQTGQADSGSDVKNPDTIIFDVDTGTASLDPATVYDPTGVAINWQIYETLLSYNPETGELKPWLAESYTVSDDGLTYTFNLRQGITFHDGTPFNAEAVKKNFDRAIIMAQPRGASSYLSGLIKGSKEYAASEKTAADVEKYLNAEGIKVVGEYVVEFHLERIYPAFDLLMGIPYTGIISPTFVEQNGGVEPGLENAQIASSASGTGPYKLKSFDVGSGIATLEAFEDYWGTPDNTGPAKVKNVIIRPVSDPLMRVMNLKTGESDMAIIPPSDLYQFIDLGQWMGSNQLESTVKGVSVLGPFPLNRIEAIGMNVNIKNADGTPKAFQPFSNPKVREAFILAFDAEDYIKQVLQGFGMEINGPIPQGWLGHNESIPTQEFNFERAKELLLEAGQEMGFSPSNPQTIDLTYPSGEKETESAFLMLSSVINQMDVGLQLKLNPVAYANFSSMLYAGSLDMVRVSWVGGFPDPDGNLTAFADGHSGTLAKVTGYLNPQVMELLEKQRVELDKNAREALIREASELINNDNMYIWRSQRTTFWVQRDWIQGYEHNRLSIGPYMYNLKKGS